jgi:hypothetical protein
MTSILSLMLVNRSSGQWDYEADDKTMQLEQERGWPFADSKRATLRASPLIHRPKIPVGWHWSDVLAVGESIGETPTKAMCGIATNPELTGVFPSATYLSYMLRIWLAARAAKPCGMLRSQPPHRWAFDLR